MRDGLLVLRRSGQADINIVAGTTVQARKSFPITGIHHVKQGQQIEFQEHAGEVKVIVHNEEREKFDDFELSLDQCKDNLQAAADNLELLQ